MKDIFHAVLELIHADNLYNSNRIPDIICV